MGWLITMFSSCELSERLFSVDSEHKLGIDFIRYITTYFGKKQVNIDRSSDCSACQASWIYSWCKEYYPTGFMWFIGDLKCSNIVWLYCLAVVRLHLLSSLPSQCAMCQVSIEQIKLTLILLIVVSAHPVNGLVACAMYLNPPYLWAIW